MDLEIVCFFMAFTEVPTHPPYFGIGILGIRALILRYRRNYYNVVVVVVMLYIGHHMPENIYTALPGSPVFGMADSQHHLTPTHTHTLRNGLHHLNYRTEKQKPKELALKSIKLVNHAPKVQTLLCMPLPHDTNNTLCAFSPICFTNLDI